MNIRTHLDMFRGLEVANWMHRNQKRKTSDTPYIIHPFHVIFLLIHYGLNPDKPEHLEIIWAGGTHDGLEDNPEEASFELIAKKLSPETARITEGVTLDPENPDKRASRAKVLRSDWKIKIVKAADVFSNTLATITSIHERGFKETQKHFRVPILERVQMEREFLDAMTFKDHNERLYLEALVEDALHALDELEKLCRKQ